MYDKNLPLEIVEQMIDAVEIVQERCLFAKTEDDFLDTKEEQEKLDSICMKLIAVGESLKKIDTITEKKAIGQISTDRMEKIQRNKRFYISSLF